MKRLPIATLDPVIKYSKGNLSFDFPLTYLTDYFFDGKDYGDCESEPDKLRFTFVNTLENRGLSVNDSILEVLDKGPVSFEEAGKRYGKAWRLENPGEFLGPHIKSDLISSANVDIRPWREIEQEYEKFLIICQPVWCEHHLGFLRHITEESIRKVRCEKLLECLQNGRAKLIIQIPWESGWWAPDEFPRIKPEFIDRLGIREDSVWFIFPQSDQVQVKMKDWYNLNVLPFAYFESNPWEYSNGKEFCRENAYEIFRDLENVRKNLINSLESREKVENSILFFNHTGNPNPVKMTLYSILSVLGHANYNISNRANFSIRDNLQFAKERLLEQPKYRDLVGCERFDKLIHVMDLDVKSKEVCGTGFFDVFSDPYVKNSLIEVFSETIARDYNDSPDTGNTVLYFSTEKTFKPLGSMKPFFMVGNKGALENLHRMGYRTFDRWWDESYDEEEDIYMRLLKIYLEMEKLCRKTPSELFDMIQDMKDTLIYNFDLRWHRAISGTERFIQILNQIYSR